MQCSQACNKHVVGLRMLVVLGICQHVTAELTSAEVTETNTIVNMFENMTACSNCSLEARQKTNSEENCKNSRGWNLRGSDWGCCGNYVGCCTYASYVCYFHDALCRCCDIGGKLCGPTCKPEPGCASSAAHTFQNNTEVNRNVYSKKSRIEPPLNIENFEQENNTEFRNTSLKNYFVRSRATSGTSELRFQDGGSNEEGSGDAEKEPK